MTTTLAVADAPPTTTLIRCPGKAYGRVEATDTGYEIVFGNGRRAPLTYPQALEPELRASLGCNVALTGISLFEIQGLRTIEFIVQSIYKRPPYDAALFRERMDLLAQRFGPLFANVDPLKFGREDDE